MKLLIKKIKNNFLLIVMDKNFISHLIWLVLLNES